MSVVYRSDIGASRRRGAVAVLAVIAIHLALYGWLRSSGGWRMRHDAPAEPALVTLRLLPWTEAPVPQTAAEPVAESAPARPRSAFGPISAPTPARARGDQVSAPDTAPTSPQAAAGATPSPPASSTLPVPPESPPLNLTLPPGYSRRPGARNPALDDPRANTARTTPEQRMAASLDMRVIEEDLGDGRRRIRQGDKCVIVTPSRIGQLMPFNEAAARTPSLVSPCP